MKNSAFSRHVLSGCVAAAILVGCGGSQPPIGAPGAMLQTSTIATHADRGKSWMLPEVTKHGLLYVSNWSSSKVTVYTYPEGQLVGKLTGFAQPYGECVDTSGDVFITNFNGSNIFEYRRGGLRPKAIISDSGEHPAGCSVDPTTGNLAVNNSYTVSNEAGSISLYKYNPHHRWGTPTIIGDSSFFYMYFCGFDATGNLFVDGYTSYGGSFILAVLPAGSGTFTNLSLNQTIEVPGGIMWDGQHMTLADSGLSPSVIYRFTVSGSTATVVGSTTLSGSDVVQYWINGAKIVGPQPKTSSVGIWDYPAGGEAVRSVANGLHTPGGLTVSPSRE
jgi:hypothetical protein